MLRPRRRRSPVAPWSPPRCHYRGWCVIWPRWSALVPAQDGRAEAPRSFPPPPAPTETRCALADPEVVAEAWDACAPRSSCGSVRGGVPDLDVRRTFPTKARFRYESCWWTWWKIHARYGDGDLPRERIDGRVGRSAVEDGVRRGSRSGGQLVDRLPPGPQRSMNNCYQGYAHPNEWD